MVKKNFRDQVVDTLIDQIAAGTAPWQKPWEPGNVRVPAFNPATGKPYRGMNQIWLEAQGFADPRWTTYRQSQANGYQVRKGEKGTQIEYWQWSDRRPMTDNSGAPILNDDGKQRYQEVRLERPKVFHAVVFNGSQIDGLEPFIGQEPNFNRFFPTSMFLSFTISVTAHSINPGRMKSICRQKGCSKVSMNITRPLCMKAAIQLAIIRGLHAKVAPLVLNPMLAKSFGQR